MSMIEHSSQEIENFINYLDADEVQILVEVFNKLDRLQVKDGQPVWNNDEIDLIGKVQDFLRTDNDDDASESASVSSSVPGLPV